MQVSTLAWSDYIGRIGCGRVLQGAHRSGRRAPAHDARAGCRLGKHEAGWEVDRQTGERPFTHLWVTRGLEREEVDEVAAGDIVWIAGPEEITIGDTLSAPRARGRRPCRRWRSKSRPSRMFFLVNNGPFAGQDGNAVTLRQIKERLERELRINVALRVEDIGRPDGVKVSGRGELHLAHPDRGDAPRGDGTAASRAPRSSPTATRTARLLEPMEQLIIDVPDEYQGVVIEKLASARAS